MITRNGILLKIDYWGLSDQKLFRNSNVFVVNFIGISIIVSLLGVSFDNKLFALLWISMWFILAVKHIILKQEKTK